MPVLKGNDTTEYQKVTFLSQYEWSAYKMVRPKSQSLLEAE